MFEQIIHLGIKKITTVVNDTQKNQIDNNEIFSPLNMEMPIKDSSLFTKLIQNAIAYTEKDKDLTFLLPDVVFASKVLQFDKLPISLKKKEELIHWKLKNFLPAKESLYTVRYSIKDNFVLTFALPNSVFNSINKCISDAYSNCYNIMPEMLYLLNKLTNAHNENCILIINRDLYFSVGLIENGFPRFIRTRIKNQNISIEQEIETAIKIIEEQNGITNKNIIVFGNPVENMKSMVQEWN